MIPKIPLSQYVLAALLAVAGSASGNGGAVNIYTSPTSSSPAQPSLTLEGKSFGFASIAKGQVVLLDIDEAYFGSFGSKHWLHPSEKDLVSRKTLALFSKSGFLCTVLAKSPESIDINTACEAELKKLPKYYKVIFLLPAASEGEWGERQADARPMEAADRPLIESAAINAISNYARKKGLKDINLKFLKTKTTITAIGMKNTIRQYFVEVRVGSRLGLQGHMAVNSKAKPPATPGRIEKAML